MDQSSATKWWQAMLMNGKRYVKRTILLMTYWSRDKQFFRNNKCVVLMSIS